MAKEEKLEQDRMYVGLEFVGKTVQELNGTIASLRAEVAGVRAELLAVTQELRNIGAQVQRFR
jgi:uncharacterized coiled-coil protein SlyX